MVRATPLPIETWARRFRPAIMAYIARRVGDQSEIEDLTQEVLTALVRGSSSAQIVNVEGYIFHIAANVLRDRARRARRRPLLYGDAYDLASESLTDGISPYRVVQGREDCEYLVRLLQEMPERMRTIFVLNRFEDMTGREIAARLGLSVSAVEKNMMRAIAFLKERL